MYSLMKNYIIVTIDGVLLRCLNNDESKSLMGEIHEGVYGAHQSTFKMKLLVQKLISKHKGLIPDSNVKVCQPI